MEDFPLFPDRLFLSGGEIVKFPPECVRRLKGHAPGGGWLALERTEKPGGFEVAVSTALKPPTTYQVTKLPGGAEQRRNQCCCGAETILGGKLVFSTWHPELVQLRASLGLPRHPVQIVATLRGLSFEGLLFNEPSLRVIVLPPMIFASPKSMTLMRPSGVRLMFAPLMSRWTIL